MWSSHSFQQQCFSAKFSYVAAQYQVFDFDLCHLQSNVYVYSLVA